jgi:LysR family transcriptional regulator, glycine cleavage system transcriptional activator
MSNVHKCPRSRRAQPSITALTAFEAAARTASFTAAAEELALTQSAVSREISTLEERLGVRLFDRVRQRVVLTPAGALYAQRVRDILHSLALATSEVMSSRSQAAVLRLGILSTFGTRWLIPRMPDFFSRFPGTDVNFITSRPRSLDFDRDNRDATIFIGIPQGRGVKFLKLADLEMVPVAAPALAKTLLSLTDLQSSTLLLYEQDWWLEWFSYAGLDATLFARYMKFETYQMVFEAATAGLGVAIVPSLIATRELQTGELVPLFDLPPMRGGAIYLAYPDKKEDYPPLANFREWLRGRVEPSRSEYAAQAHAVCRLL